MKTFMIFCAALVLAIVPVFMFTSCNDDEVVVPFPQPGEPELTIDDLAFGIDESPYGKSYNEWIDEWLAIFPDSVATQPVWNGSYLFTIPDKTNTIYFMAGLAGGTAARTIILDAEKAILFPVLNTIQTYPCPLHVASDPSSEQTIEEFLQAETSRILSKETEVSFTLDGHHFSLADHRIISDEFVINNGEALGTFFDACIIPDLRQRAVWGGNWVMLRGLKKGLHILTLKGELPYYGATNVNYRIDAR